MKISRFYCLLAGLSLLNGQMVFAAETDPAPPPVALFAAHAQIQDVKISPDGKHIAFTYEEANNEVKLAIATSDLKAALLIIHGSKDIRVPLAQAEFLRDQLDEAGKSYQWLVRKEGHGFTKVANRIDQYEQMLSFLDLHIGATAQVAQR